MPSVAAVSHSNLAGPQVTLACYDLYNTVVCHVLGHTCCIRYLFTPQTSLTWLIDTGTAGVRNSTLSQLALERSVSRRLVRHMRHGFTTDRNFIFQYTCGLVGQLTLRSSGRTAMVNHRALRPALGLFHQSVVVDNMIHLKDALLGNRDCHGNVNSTSSMAKYVAASDDFASEIISAHFFSGVFVRDVTWSKSLGSETAGFSDSLSLSSCRDR